MANTIAAVEAGVTPLPVHRQRVRRAARQRRPVRHGRQPATQARAAGPTGRLPGRRWCASRTPSRRSPTSPPTPTRPTSGPPPSPTRRGCTRARSRWIRCSTTTWSRPSSGNDMRILVTEMAGRASIELKSRELGLDLAGHPEALSRVTDRVKELEARGWSFEAADASFELLVRSELPGGVARPVHPGVVPGHRWSTARTARSSPRRRSRYGYAANGSSPPPRATDRSTRSTRRCARRCSRHFPAAGRLRAGRLQGPHPGGLARHRGGHPGTGRDAQRRRPRLDHGRRARQRRRGELARARRRPHLRSAPRRRPRLNTFSAVYAGAPYWPFLLNRVPLQTLGDERRRRRPGVARGGGRRGVRWAEDPIDTRQR